MFADACEEAWKFTRPVVTGVHRSDGTCDAGAATFVIVNDAGWFLTAAHVWRAILDLDAQVKATIAGRASAPAPQPRHVRRAAAKGGTAATSVQIEHYMAWWGDDMGDVDQWFMIPEVDLMLGHFSRFTPLASGVYPRFKDPAKGVRQGTSLCRLGYPFSKVGVTFDAAKTQFGFDRSTLTAFAIDGILTRQIKVNDNAAGYFNASLETSSPGLIGQSGGPIIDCRGVVWAIQSRTDSYSLGFDPPVPKGAPPGSSKWEHQFLNVGLGAHPVTIAGLLTEKKVHFTLVP